MSFRARVLDILEVALRVPPLFVIDEILKYGLGISELEQNLVVVPPELTLEKSLNETTGSVRTPENLGNEVIYRFLFDTLLRLVLSTAACGGALGLFILNTKYLMVVYMYLMSIGVIFLSYWTNMAAVKRATLQHTTIEVPQVLLDLLLIKYDSILEYHGQAFQILQNCVIQLFLSFVFINIHLGPRYSGVQKLLPLSFVAPSLLTLLPLPKALVVSTPIFSVLLPMTLVMFALWTSIFSIAASLYSGYLHLRTMITTYGFSHLIETEWSRLNVPEVLRTFWILRVVEYTTIFFLSGLWGVEDGYSPWFRLMKFIMVTGCDTLTGVLGITSIVSYICNYIGKFFQWILLNDDETDKNFGTVSAIVFYILALQTGLTGLEPDIRFVRLCRNFCLLFTALLHFTHNVVNPLLMSLSASHNPSFRRHAHALLVCAVLLIFPSILMYFLWTTQQTSTWLLAVTVFSIEVIVKVFVSLAIYSLFLLDAHRSTFWEKLDDYIYYIRAFGNTVEFCFGIFLFFNGAWILIFESGSAIRAVMMCIHAYFNIWCDAKAGWSVFMKRRTAVNKIESLPEADKEQLRRHNDVCAICYQEMQTAKITKCKHLFHGVCLRKWLYVQDRCPLCHEVLHSLDDEQSKTNMVTVEAEDDNYFR